MKEKLKNIFNLSKIFIKENENILLNKINKKSLMFWIYVVLIFALTYLSSEIVTYIKRMGKPEIFINGVLLFINILVIIRTILVSLNVFYFSKNIENILHLPLKPIEILIAKFNTLLFMNYQIELIFGIIPLLIYGLYLNI